MVLYAIEDLDDAWVATREFLTPLSVERLLVLAVIVFFVGGTSTNFPGGGGGGAPAETDPGAEQGLDALWAFVVENALAIGLIGGTIVLLILLFTLVGAVMEFVFVQSLRTDEVRFWGYSRSYLGEGLRLFGFRIALGTVGLLIAAVVLGFGLAAIGVGPLPEIGGAILVVLGLLAAVVFVLLTITNALTTTFVVPIMLVRESGVLDGWRAFWPTLVGQWKQYLAYGIAALILNIALGIVFVLLLAIAAIGVLIPVGIVVAGIAFLAEPLLAPVVIVFGVLFVGGLILVALLVQVPMQTYLRYYALLILGDTNEALDPIPDVRASVRDTGESLDGPEAI
ncbi:DUF4013 domain-containing protein [Halalkalicoccus sp. NIPERK01]|uniref:DUF7544 domain-containing protein n=1 Tax=Halalkalicoccus sp. NIPERK01 TaxID=3053469 RepID=UPI00256F3753|nr:DUF4013 domain-containing protein [Halalkalicoccus sp. NIPERK01]MDL5360810.1 DUF4013 domain-containing protein [Halalkalicoccus sp. NIPERK01]